MIIMDEIQEEIFSGFCRTCNQGQTVTCEFILEEGAYVLESVDCAFERCIHTASCEIAKQIREKLAKE